MFESVGTLPRADTEAVDGFVKFFFFLITYMCKMVSAQIDVEIVVMEVSRLVWPIFIHITF